jgi:hypothetical protein
MHYRLNEPDVIQETVEGATLIVHSRSGTYYSLEGSGTFIWNALLAGHPVARIEDCFAGGSEGERAAVRDGMGAFLQALLAENLIVPAAGIPAETPPVAGTAERKPAFANPELRKFTDMQELLLVDPIHDVQPEAGWPLQKDPPTTG